MAEEEVIRAVKDGGRSTRIRVLTDVAVSVTERASTCAYRVSSHLVGSKVVPQATVLKAVEALLYAPPRGGRWCSRSPGAAAEALAIRLGAGPRRDSAPVESV